ncbi:MAG: hypothetical protein WA865_08010 [Spirulinaceae cyanobacterium]
MEWASVDNAVGSNNAAITEQTQTLYQQAQGWEITSDGKIILTATATEVASHQNRMQHPDCGSGM